MRRITSVLAGYLRANRTRLAGILALLLLLAGSIPAHAGSLLHLNASVTRSEYTAGDAFTVVAYLFNDGDAPSGQVNLTIAPAAGFEMIDARAAAGVIAPGGHIGAQWSYRVTPDTPKGLARFVVRGGGQVAEVVIRVGPVEAPPAQRPVYRVYLGSVRR